jgi:hypothetical protein
MIRGSPNQKTRVMSIVDGEEIRTVSSYKFLGALITTDYYSSPMTAISMTRSREE